MLCLHRELPQKWALFVAFFQLPLWGLFLLRDWLLLPGSQLPLLGVWENVLLERLLPGTPRELY